jgi:septal ring factor EnvC (AmiA/AmiB activator)
MVVDFVMSQIFPSHNSAVAHFTAFSPEELRNALAFTQASRATLSSEIRWLEDKVTESQTGLEFYQRRLGNRRSRMDDINKEIGQLHAQQLTQAEYDYLHRYLNSSNSDFEGDGVVTDEEIDNAFL